MTTHLSTFETFNRNYPLVRLWPQLSDKLNDCGGKCESEGRVFPLAASVPQKLDQQQRGPDVAQESQ